MLKKALMLTSIIGFGILFSGCATILDGKTQNINLSSSTEKTVEINGQNFRAPGVITLQRDDKDAILKVEGCENDVLLTKSVNPTFFVNILSGGVFGSTTDYASKSMWKYDQKNVDVDCK